MSTSSDSHPTLTVDQLYQELRVLESIDEIIDRANVMQLMGLPVEVIIVNRKNGWVELRIFNNYRNILNLAS